MPSSGARAGTAPSRSERGAGDGRVGPRFLTCGHVALGEPSFRRAGQNGLNRYWCSDCGCFRRRK